MNVVNTTTAWQKETWDNFDSIDSLTYKNLNI